MSTHEIKRTSTYPPGAWKPVPGDDGTFCSRACGAGCTYDQYKAAHAAGQALAKRLGEGWTYDVWENMAWYYRAISPCERIKVHPPTRIEGERGKFGAYLGEPGSAGGKWVARHEDPKEAIRLVIAAARASLDKIGAILEGLPD